MIVGVSDHNGWAVFVTVDDDGSLIDRRRVELVDKSLPCMPHHHEGQMMPLEQAVALVERVRLSAEQHARLGLDALAAALPSRLLGIAMRVCPPLPATVAERITNYRAQTVADTVMYRTALAGAAEERGWAVHWYEARRVADAACAALRVDELETRFSYIRKSLGPPWGSDHRTAMAAAIVAAKATRT